MRQAINKKNNNRNLNLTWIFVFFFNYFCDCCNVNTERKIMAHGLKVYLLAVASVFLLSQLPSTDAGFFKYSPFKEENNVGSWNGGSSCLTCVYLVGLFKNIMQARNLNGTQTIDYFCEILPYPFHDACETIKGLIDVILVNKLDSGESADVICYSLFFCTQDPGHDHCHLYPEPAEGMELAVKKSIERDGTDFEFDLISICNMTTIEPVCKLLNLIDGDYTAKSDDDGDTFSTLGPLRGSDWRGQDCSDDNANYHPGHLPIDYDIEFDSNCNGIYGVNPDTGNPYELDYCAGQNNYGTIMYGDSIGAHFHIPPDWFRGNVVDAYLMENLTYIAANELDWPHMSFSTGHVNSTWAVAIDSPTNSIYWRLRNRNLCVNGDFQNLAFNGASSLDNTKNLINMTRDAGIDNPAIVIYAMFGNDICSSDDGAVDGMTSVEDFIEGVNSSLAYLNTRLPPNSHVITIGLVNGTYLYSILKGHLHPLGEMNNDVTYDNVYDFYSCLGEVCPSWTTTNATVAQGATAHAMELSNALRDLANSVNYDRFDVHYLDCPLDRAVAEYTGNQVDLIEPIDALHPSKYGQDLFAQVLWEMIEEQFPEILGPVNPHNDDILNHFGNLINY